MTNRIESISRQQLFFIFRRKNTRREIAEMFQVRTRNETVPDNVATVEKVDDVMFYVPES